MCRATPWSRYWKGRRQWFLRLPWASDTLFCPPSHPKYLRKTNLTAAPCRGADARHAAPAAPQVHAAHAGLVDVVGAGAGKGAALGTAPLRRVVFAARQGLAIGDNWNCHLRGNCPGARRKQATIRGQHRATSALGRPCTGAGSHRDCFDFAGSKDGSPC